MNQLNRNNIIFIIAIIIIIVIAYQLYSMDIQAQREQQINYPYHGFIPDSLWDTCVSEKTVDINENLHITYGRVFADTEICNQLYDWAIRWDNTYMREYNINGIYCWKYRDYGECIKPII